MTEHYDAVVVGAGPAGSCAATVLARAGRRVLLVERGPFPGSKNMYGGVVYPRILDGLHPAWWEEAPIQRWVTRRSTMFLTPTQAMTVDIRTAAWGQPPYNGATAYRPDFDHWLAGKAEADGAELVCSTTVVGLLRERGRSGRRRAHRPARRRRAGEGGHRLRRGQQLLRQGGRALRPRHRRPLHAGCQGDAGPAQGGHRRALRGARPGGRRHRDRRRHGRRERGIVPLHQPRHRRRRRRAPAAHAGRAAASPRGDHRRPQGAPGDRAPGGRRRGEGVLGAPDPRGRAGDDAADDGRRDARRR